MSHPLRLTTLGGLALTAVDRPLGAAARQRRPLAVLALLAMAGETGVRRDKLTAILWPDAEPERARQTLAQTLYSLRRATGVDELTPGVGDLRLNPGVVSCDLTEFDAALRAGRLEDGVALYHGPFLDGFHVPGSDDFDRWMEGERQRVAARYAGALRDLAARATSAGDSGATIDWLRKLVAADPLDSAATLSLIDALAGAGDLPGAERVARAHEALVREELELPLVPAIGARLAVLRAEAATRGQERARLDERRGRVVEPADGSAEATSVGPGGAGTAADSPAHVAALSTAGGERGSRTWARQLMLLTAAVVLTGLGAVLGFTAGRGRVRETAAAVPAGVPRAGGVAVLPFENETRDPSLATLGSGAADLLARQLAGAAGLRPIDPGAVEASLARAPVGGPATGLAAARQVGAALGADEVLVGRVAGSVRELAVTAALVSVRSGAERASASVAGPADSLPALVDALAATLLAGREMGWDRRSPFAHVSLRTLQPFLLAEEASRLERFHRATVLYARVLDRDSTFAPAALGLAVTADRLNGAEQHAGGLALAWASRRRLGERDRTELAALAGPRYPDPSPVNEQLAAWERVVAVSPDHAGAWSELGARLFHDGAALGIEDAPRRAAAAFRRAIELDPHDASAERYRIELAARSGDAGDRPPRATPEASEHVRDAGAHLAGYLTWRSAQARHDSAALGHVRDGFPTLTPQSLRAIAVAAEYDGIGLADGERALRYLGARAALASERLDVLLAQHSLALNTGLPERALEITEQLQDLRPRTRAHLRLRVLDALYADGDSAAAWAAVAELAQGAGAGPAAGERERAVWLADVCVLAQWRVARLPSVPRPGGSAADVAAIRHAVSVLRAAATPRVPVPVASAPRACAALVEAALDVAEHRPDARARVEALASLALTGPVLGDARTYAMLAVGRLFARLGEPERALAEVRQRPYLNGWPRYLATVLRTEGELALAVGDTARARAALDRYLAFRGGPAPSLRPAADRVRAMVARLGAAPGAPGEVAGGRGGR